MKYLLDTDVVSEVIKNNTLVKNAYTTAVLCGDDICISAITYYELHRGFMSSNDTKRLISKFHKIYVNMEIKYPKSQKLYKKAADIWSRVPASFREKGDADILIAATAILNNARLVTNNYGHFVIIQNVSPDLILEDWNN